MKLEMMQEKRTVLANAGMHKYAFVNARKIAENLNGVVGTNDEGNFKATFKSEKVAKQFVTEWNAHYEQAVANKKPKAEAEKKTTSGKGKGAKKSKKATTRKPTTAKGSAKMTKKEIRSWAWKQADGDRAKYDELCKSKGVDNHR